MNGFASRLLSFALLLTFAVGGFAQQSSLSIKGTITDQLGGLVVGASVAARDSKGNSVTVTSNEDGVYQFHNLLPGKYDLIVSSPGFSTLDEKNVELKSGKTLVHDLQLAIGSVETIVTVDNKSVSTDSDRNADALVLGLKELEALPTDPDALAAVLQAMAGPTIGDENGGGNGAQIKVDGFSNGKIPPKEQIREVRFNQNPYSAENEYPGWGGIEIYTQPGSDKFHGNASFNFADESLNSRNPFALVRAPYQQRLWNVNLTGPLKKKRASFNFGFYRSATDSNAIINATTLDLITLKPLTVNQTIVTPSAFDELDLRGDFKINKKHTLVAGYEYDNSHRDPAGIGGFNLPLRGFRSESIYHRFQMTETAVINEKMINETRFQITHSVERQLAKNAIPALNVAESFNGGGAQIGNASSTYDRAELQNFTSWQKGKHFIKVGGRFRYVDVKSVSPSNFGGTYTFSGGAGPALDANDQIIPGAAPLALSSLERYRRTLAFQRAGLSASQIRLLGGGATQLSIAGGNPEALVDQGDVSLYAQDDWKLRQHLTISPGLRYENQNNIDSNFNFAPRLSVAWSPMFLARKPPAPPSNPAAATANKPADAKTAAPTTTASPADAKTAATALPAIAPKPPPRQPSIVIRAGVGIFYNRVSEDYTLNAFRFNGTTQQQFVVTDPAVLDLFPAIPPIEALEAFKLPQTRRQLSDNIYPNTALRGSASFEHQLNKTYRYSVTYSFGRMLHSMRTVNINAPLGGTYNPVDPTSGVRPLGKSAGNILEYQSNGRYVYDNVSVNASGSLFKVSFWASYVWSSTRSIDSGSSGSPLDAYDFSNEFGRAPYDIHHRVFGGVNWQSKKGWSFNSFIGANSGAPFNITTGHDTNGDNAFSERPAFAADLSKPGVMLTPYGALDPNPVAGQKIIPRNFGQGPAFISVGVSAAKTWKFGRAIPAKIPPAIAGAVVSTTAAAPPAGNAKPPVQRPYSLTFSVYANNLLNRNNRGAPVGNMASPYFLKSTGSSGQNFFVGGSGGPGGNRNISMRLRLAF
jgi:Carboxypeptidase regulatory-like domain/TonB dependent receptor-like, beta-barrel